MEINNLEDMIFQYIDKVRRLFSADIWQNILMDCSKNEIYILLLLYRQNEANMTLVAEHIDTPLNTATGIITRMEKKGIVIRERSPEDKRVVTIRLSEAGKGCINSIIKAFLHYGELIMESFSADEIQLVFQLLDKGINVFSSHQKNKQEAPRNETIRRIEID